MEIKQGDTVRVSKDAPKMYLRGFDHIFTGVESVVSEVEDDNAVIIFNTDHVNSQTTIPVKYLVKVDAEVKEAKFKVGDRVRNVKSDLCGIVLKIEHGIVEVGIPYDKGRHYWNTDIVELFEPTEQTEEEKTKTTHSGNLVFPIAFDLNKALNNCDCFTSVRELIRMKQRDMEENNKPRYVPKIMFNTEFWVKYEADLAKEVALKVANKFNTPEQAAEYAVSVAKSVVEGLKRK